MVDLATFKPKSSDELLKGILEVSINAAGSAWKSMKKEVQSHLVFISKQTINTTVKLGSGQITEREAEHTFHLLEFNLNSAMLLAAAIPFIVVHAVLKAVFGLIDAVIKNITGIDLAFSS